MKKLAVLAMAGLMSVTASASNWVQFEVSSIDGVEFEIDTDSIISSGFYKKAFIKHIYPDVTTEGGIKFNSVVGLYQIDCTSQPMRIRLESAIFRLNSELVFNSDDPAEWIFAYPDTVAEAFIDFVCSY